MKSSSFKRKKTLRLLHKPSVIHNLHMYSPSLLHNPSVLDKHSKSHSQLVSASEVVHRFVTIAENLGPAALLSGIAMRRVRGRPTYSYRRRQQSCSGSKAPFNSASWLPATSTDIRIKLLISGKINFALANKTTNSDKQTLICSAIAPLTYTYRS